MATRAADMMLHCVFEGSISMYDMDIERRPYHRNCSCALHKSKGTCSNTCFQHRNISFPKKQNWNECFLSSSSASKFSPQSSVVNGLSARSRDNTTESLSSSR